MFELRQVIRGLRRSRGFALTAILVLAIGIGANTAVFSVANAVLLKPLPYRDSDRIVIVWEKRSKEGTRTNAVSAADFIDWRGRSRSFAAMDAFDDQFGMNLTGGKPERVVALLATSQMVTVYGIEPVLGRGFTAADEAGDTRVILLSYRFWQRRFGGDPAVIGQSIHLNDAAYRIAGVLPENYRMMLGLETDVYLPLVLTPRDQQDRAAHRFLVVGRLRPGVSLAQAQVEMDTISSQIARAHPNENEGHSANLVPLKDQFTAQIRPALWLLLVAVGFLLLLASANVANLLLARAAVREREIAIRRALGATTGRLVRLLLTESAALALAGGIIGIGFAKGAISLMPLLPKTLGLAGIDVISVDSSVLAFTFAISTVTGILFGLVPALKVARPGHELRTAVRHLTLRRVLVAGEVAIACTMLVGALLLTRSFLKLMEVSPGFQAANRLGIELSLPAARYRDPARQTAFYDELLRRVSALPSVTSAALTSLMPGSTWGPRFGLAIEGRPRPRTLEDWPKASWRVVSNGFFSTMGIPILRGRSFDSGDRAGTQEVVVLSEATVQRYFAGVDPIGKRIALGYDPAWRIVIGVAGSVKYLGVDKDTAPEFYLPLSQFSVPGLEVALVVRAAQDPLALAGALRTTIGEVDSELPIGRVRTLEQMLNESVAPKRFQAGLVAAFAGISLLLAAGGLYSVMAYLVAQRTREIGIRIAVGATRNDVLALVLWEGGLLGVCGVAFGLAAALAGARVLKSFLFGVSPAEPVVLGGASVVLILIALAASAVPALRAARLDPTVALRHE